MHRAGRASVHLPVGLIIGKPKQLVLDRRPAHCVSVLVPLQSSFARVEESPGVQIVIPQKLKCCAVDGVRSALGNGVHERAAEAAVFGIETVGNQVELLNRVEIRLDSGLEVRSARHVAAIDQKTVAILALAVD